MLITKLFSQSNIALTKTKEELTKQKDVIDLLHFKRVAGDEEEGKRCMKPRLTILPFVGYTLQTRLAAILAGNIAFYVDENKETNQSAISASISYSQNNQIIAPIISNIWSRKNKYNFLGNWRYYKYPESTYGLGGYTSVKDISKIDYSYILFREAVLRHVANSFFYTGIGYNFSYHTKIIQVPNATGTPTDFDRYGRKKTSVSSGLSAILLFDNRGNTINPQKGTYANINYCPYFTNLGSDNNWQSITVDLRKYLKFGHSKNTLALWSYNWFTFNGKTPYLDLPATGWDASSNIGRGYIQSRFRAANLLYMEAEYRFGITHNGLLGGVVFSNVQSVSDRPHNTFNVLYPAVGGGLRIKLNKYSGTNLSIDYGVGIKGSKGLFINLGEVF